MRILLVTPAPARSRKGNRITALRWARFLRELGHRVTLRQQYSGERCELLVALHAKRSFASVERFRREHPDSPLVVAMTGTDLYQDIHTSASARKSLELATRLVVLQPAGILELPEHVRDKARVIYQSLPMPRNRPSPSEREFEVCVLGHLRSVKDPFRTALAARKLPDFSRIRILHIGAALSDAMAAQAKREAARNPRYRWLGELPRWKARQVLARCRLLVLSSKMEGGANVVSEAIVASVPILASDISGSVGLLGRNYPGYFPVGDTQELATLLLRAELDRQFYARLRSCCERRRPLFEPARERECWKRLIAEMYPGAESA